jgi:hypothetical protein
MLSIDIFRASSHRDPCLSVPTENESEPATQPRPPHLPPLYSAEPREGEQTVRCDRLPTYRQVVRLHRRRHFFAWLPGLGRLQRAQPHDQDDIELGEMAVVYRRPDETDESFGKFVVSGQQLVCALMFAVMVGIAISKPI